MRDDEADRTESETDTPVPRAETITFLCARRARRSERVRLHCRSTVHRAPRLARTTFAE
jgi:hypothetical protein